MEKLVPALVARLDVDLTNFPSSLPLRSRQGHRRQGFRAQEGGALRRGHRPRRADPPRPRRGTCTSPRRAPSENHAKNRVEKFTPLTLPFRFIQVDERLNGDGTGLIFGVNDESLGFILLLVPTLIFGLYYTANTKDDNIMAGGKDDDSGLSL